MSFPQFVIDYLQGTFAADSHPVCFLIDRESRLLEMWGDASWCDMSSIQTGDDMLTHAPFLFGSFGDKPNILEFVSISSGTAAHVHIVPIDDNYYVILLDAKQEHDSIQQRQQSVNELKLLHASQQRLIMRQRDLISELVEARAELDHHRKDAERSSLSKGEFIAMMSHEFRTPLASIINYASLAIESDDVDNRVRKSIETIGRSARHLTSLVEAVLDEARLDAGQIDLVEAEFDLHALLGDLAAMMAPMAADKELSFVCKLDAAVPKVIRADEVRFRQILINLLGNAIKFTEVGSIQLLTTYADGRLVSSVTDTGPGISIADQEKVFRAFERGAAQQSAGAGLGLTISLRLAKLMGGEISLDSAPGQGCTIAVNLPVSIGAGSMAPSATALGAPPEESHATQAVTVLVCDDDEDMLALIEYYLHRAGYGLIVTTNGTDAVSKTLAYQPDIVLMDCSLPGISGPEVALQLRSQGFANPVIAHTASRLGAEDQSRFTRYFRKPADMNALLNEIKLLSHGDSCAKH
ncbi:MAG: ATP-binding response regulator [Woeseiaceae bacterium]